MGLARRLQARGFRVEFWGEPGSRNLVRTQRFEHYELQEAWYCHERLLPPGWPSLLARPAAAAAMLRSLRSRKRGTAAALTRFEQSLDRQLARSCPVLVILDSMLAAYLPLLHKRRVNCVLLQDKPLPLPDPLVPPPTSSLVPSNTWWGRADVRLRWGYEHVGALRRAIGSGLLGMLGAYTSEQLLKHIRSNAAHECSVMRPYRRVSYDLHYEGAQEWVLGTPEDDFRRLAPLPAHIRYIGPCVDLERIQARSTAVNAAETERMIYVSMGTTVPRWNSDLPLLRRIIEAFGGVRGVRLAIASGNARARAALRNDFPNVHISAYLPQLSMLERADLAITHAGANAFRECIATGTAMLAFPREFDQPGNAARVMYLGLGLRGSRRFDCPQSIREKGMRVLQDTRYTERARELKATVERLEPLLLESALRAVVRV